jgi:hypothetical protein
MKNDSAWRYQMGYQGRISSCSVILLLALTVPGCTTSGDPALEPGGLRANVEDEILFLALSELPDGEMEALFDGKVSPDPAGCLRLQSDDGSTVVWPYGATLERSGGELRIRDRGGKEIGRIGGAFRFGGGHVPTLHEGIKLKDAERARALEKCPGDFWIVGSIE